MHPMIQSNFCQEGIDSKKVKNESIGGLIYSSEIKHEWGLLPMTQFDCVI